MHIGLGTVTRARAAFAIASCHRLDDDLAVDRLFARDGVGDLQQFEPGWR
jgi:hypothetical protein